MTVYMSHSLFLDLNLDLVSELSLSMHMDTKTTSYSNIGITNGLSLDWEGQQMGER